MVYGTRFRGDPGYKVPIGRRLGNLIFSVVLTAITRQKITDPTSGFRMVNRRGIELFARDYPHDYPEVEAILMLHNNRLRIHEVQVRMNARGFGRSSIDYPRAAYYMIKVMLALFVGLLRRRPEAFEGSPPPATGEFAAVEPSTATGRRRLRGARRDRPPARDRELRVGPRQEAADPRRHRHGPLPDLRDRAGPAPPARRALRAALDRGGDHPRHLRRLGGRARGGRQRARDHLAAERALPDGPRARSSSSRCTSPSRSRGSARRRRSSPRRSRGSTASSAASARARWAARRTS